MAPNGVDKILERDVLALLLASASNTTNSSLMASLGETILGNRKHLLETLGKIGLAETFDLFKRVTSL
jgi:hypothetical protein